jgi:putative membrane protein
MLLASGASFAQSPDQPGHKSPRPGTNTEAVSKVEDATAGLVGQVSAQMTTTTQGFVTAAATSDMYEVAAGKIALQRSSSSAVKEFAQKMVDAHTETTTKLKGIISANNIKVATPASVDNRRQGMLDNLRGASKAEFDNRYITQQVAAHKEANILMRGYAKDGDNAQIRDFAAETDMHEK